MRYLRTLFSIAKPGHDKTHFEMDLLKAIKELRGEKEQLDRVIASFEALEVTVNAVLQKPRRGRKSISAAERKEISARMRRYWGRKRKRSQPPNAEHIASE
jgi:hypothetical protein